MKIARMSDRTRYELIDLALTVVAILGVVGGVAAILWSLVYLIKADM